MDVVEYQEGGLALGGPGEDLEDAVEQVAALLLAGNSSGGGMSGQSRRSFGTSRATSGAASPSESRKASGLGAAASACSKASTMGM